MWSHLPNNFCPRIFDCIVAVVGTCISRPSQYRAHLRPTDRSYTGGGGCLVPYVSPGGSCYPMYPPTPFWSPMYIPRGVPAAVDTWDGKGQPVPPPQLPSGPLCMLGGILPLSMTPTPFWCPNIHLNPRGSESPDPPPGPGSRGQAWYIPTTC